MSVSDRLEPFGVTIFTEMTSLATRYGAVNLGQGFPDWDGPDFVKEAAAGSLAAGGADQYPPSAGIPQLRAAVAARYGPPLGRELDPDAEVTVTSGCTEGLAATFLGLVDPGDEVVVVEPYYDSYPVCVALAAAAPRFVRLRPPGFALDPDELRAVMSPRTKAVLINTPHNPTGRVFTREELGVVADLCVEFDALAICDEVYEEMVYDSRHHRLATWPGMADRTVTLSSVGKTYSLTGWKVGWAIAPPHLTAGIRAAHQYLTFTTPTPVQHGSAAALGAPDSFYSELRRGYRQRRDLLAAGLEQAGFDVFLPEGTYFLMAGYSRLSSLGDRDFARYLIEQAGVVVVPPSVFYHSPPSDGPTVRFAFCKSEATLTEAVGRLRGLTGS